MPSISVIVPVYNAEKYISRCVDSILSQTLSDFELLLVDDGSKDKSGSICDLYAQKDDRIHVLHKENGGVSSARNAGIEKAKGQYLLFVDSDDFIKPDLLSNLLETSCDLVICGFEKLDERGKHLFTIQFPNLTYRQREDIDFAFMYKSLMLYSPYCKLFRTDYIQENGIRFDPTVTWGEDGMFIADYLRYVNSIIVKDYCGYYYIGYDAENSLATKIRPNIVEMIERSRGYCIEKATSYAPEQATISDIIKDDIRGNCAYFVLRLVQSKSLSLFEKTRILKRFQRSESVVETICCPERYYRKDPALVSAMKRTRGAWIVFLYLVILSFGKMKNILYSKVYTRLPEHLKKIYRNIKGFKKNDT